MSVSDVTARIAQIQGQLSLLRATTPSGGTATTGATGGLGAGSTASTQFSDALSLVLGASPDGAPTGASGDSSPLADRVIAEARTFVGMPYVWGGDSPGDGGMDCSGLMQYVFGQHGVDLPRVSADQARAGTAVASMAEARPGDLVAWDNSSRNNGADHIALYLGDGKILEAPRTGLDIRIIDLAASGHGEPDYIRRVLPEATSSGSGAGGIAGVAGRVAAGRTSLPPSPYDDLFATAGARHGVDPSLLSAVAKQESSYRPGAVSPAGAQGLMQLMPGTAAGLGVDNPFDPSQAVDGAARLLRDLLDRFGRVDLALAGYNAGPGAVLRYDGVPPYPETQNYVRSVLGSLGSPAGSPA